MSDNVVDLGGGCYTSRQVHSVSGPIVPVADVLRFAGENERLAEVLVVGRMHDGTLTVASSHSNPYIALLLIEAQGLLAGCHKWEDEAGGLRE